MASDVGRHVIGLISDTHGLLRPEVFAALAGVELILHAGDVGGDEILDELSAIAPVQAVYGNTDPTDNPRLAQRIIREIGSVTIHVSHGHELGAPVPHKLLATYGEDVIVYGHTHRQSVTRSEQRLVINPGAAGPRRFKLEASVALLTVLDGVADVKIIPL